MRHNIQGVAINDAQFRSLKRLMLESIGTSLDARKHEIKELEVRDLIPAQPGRIVAVIIIAGMVGDEGTAAEDFCRRKGHFFIGRQGGIKAAPTFSRASKSDLESHPIIYGWGR